MPWRFAILLSANLFFAFVYAGSFVVEALIYSDLIVLLRLPVCLSASDVPNTFDCMGLKLSLIHI